MKKCFKCNKKKPLDMFYAHPMMADGRLNKCKECAKADVRKNYAENVEAYREYDKKRSMLPKRVKMREVYQKTEAGKAALMRARTRYKEKYPERRAAHIAAGNAIREGFLVKQPCEICGKKRVHAHHDDYSKPLSVRWLCTKHHTEHHRKDSAK